MAPFICCGFKRHPIPKSGPNLLVDNSKSRGRFPVSTTDTSESSAEAPPAIPKVCEAAASDEAQGGSFEPEEPVECEMNQSLPRKASTPNVLGVTNRFKTAALRNSRISKRSSKLSLRSSMSHEEVQRYRGLKSILPRRVASFLQDSKIGSQGGYDEDAVPIQTPRSTWGREQLATVESVPRRLTRTSERCPSPLFTSHLQTSRDVSLQSSNPCDTTGTLSRMLIAKNNRMESSSTRYKAQVETQVETEVPEAKRSRNSQKYIFNDDSRSPQNLATQSPSTLERSDTVIRVPSSSAVVELGRPTFLDTVGTHFMADLDMVGPQRVGSVGDSVVGRESRLPPTPSRNPLNRHQFPENNPQEDSGDATEHIRGSAIKVTPEAWTHGAPGIFGKTIHPENAQHNVNDSLHHMSQRGSQSILTSEEGCFSRLGDADKSIPRDKLQDISARRRFSGTGSIHLYDMHIPQRLASQGLLKSASQPFLQEFATSRDHVASDKYNSVGRNPRRRVSSSGFRDGGVPTSWGLSEKYATSSVYSQDVPKSYGTSFVYSQDVPKKCAASSVYSHESPYLKPAESDQSSITFLNKIADRMKRFGPDAPARDMIGVPITSNKHIDLDESEHKTRRTNFYSSNESLYHRELAAAVPRIVPRAKTLNLPKSSWSKGDFNDVAAAIAISNPRRRSLSERLNRTPSLSSYDGHKERHLSIRPRADRFNFIAGGSEDACTSVWEKALWEHEREDAAISHTRLGSDPALNDHDPLIPIHHRFRDPIRSPHHRHIIDRFSTHHKQGAILQAKLDAYQLPRKRTPTDELKPISTPSSHSSWSRYSSHDREQRSPASAGEADNVFARDFADEARSAARVANQAAEEIDPTASPNAARLSLEGKNDKKSQRSKSMTFGLNALSKLQKIARIGSLEFASRTGYGSRGHRSSVSEGRSTEYPELEMLPPPSPVVYSGPRAVTPRSPSSQAAFTKKKKSRSEEVAAVVASPEPEPEPIPSLNDDVQSADNMARSTRFAKSEARMIGNSSTPGARTWSKMYVEDCVAHPPNSPPQASMLNNVAVEEALTTPPIEDLGAEEVRPVGEEEGVGKENGKGKERQLGGSSERERDHASASEHMRKSTLDFKKDLESNERRAREMVLALTVDVDVDHDDDHDDCTSWHPNGAEVEQPG